eukprot:TRINITY_DN7054_c0_g1_i1.p1 TRINITY_DN7054_c0_g1~~TRINITY_DN7054_c0_g1_i1.p1  ORF type:complete len:512 (-),score=186.48 TRINITY_DN7054_c0_g1_i1:681-2216(-)
MLSRASSVSVRNRTVARAVRGFASRSSAEGVRVVSRLASSFGPVSHQINPVSVVPRPSIVFSRGYALPKHSKLALPALSPTMETGRLAKWRVKEGDKVEAGGVVAEVETDKATVDFEVTDEFYIAKYLVPEGGPEISVGQPIAITVDSAADVAAFKDYTAGSAAAAPAPKAPEPAKQPEAPKEAPKAAAPAPAPKAAPVAEETGPFVPGQPPKLATPQLAASPLAKSLAESAGIDLRQVQGTGPNGRIVKSDVAAFASSAPSAPAPASAVAAPAAVGTAGAFTDIPNSGLRKVIATRLSLSKSTIPHYYLTAEVRMDAVLTLRQQLNAQSNGAYKLSVNDFVIKAAALALKKVPTANSQWQNDFVRRFSNIDINVAINTDRGLYSPLIRDADKIGLAGLNSSVRQLADKAKANKLSPAELESGTFTISNLGMYGIKHFTAVINPPQACILAVGSTEKQVIVDESSKDGGFKAISVMNVTLSCDHRVVDGAVGAEWLAAFREYMQEPIKMLL